MRLQGRLERLARVTAEATPQRRGEGLAAGTGKSETVMLAGRRWLHTWMVWDHAQHPPRMYPNGKMDIEPSLRRLAVAVDVDPDEAVRQARAILEREWSARVSLNPGRGVQRSDADHR